MLWLEKQEWMACYQYLNRFCVFAMHGVVLQYVMGCHTPPTLSRGQGDVSEPLGVAALLVASLISQS